MTLAKLAKQAEKLIADNSPLILTAIGVTGTITTAVLASKATIKAVRLLDYEDHSADMLDEERLTLRERVDLTWKFYIPAVSTGVFTVACIVASNRIGTRRAAAMAAAYSLSEKAFVEYKDKVAEKFGDTKEQKVRDEIAQDRVNANPVSTKEVLITGNGDVLCYDSITGRYFKSTMEALRKVENDINKQLLHDGYVTLHEFYVMIGLPSTLYSSEVGWNVDTMFELRFSTTLSDTNEPCLALEYTSYPIRDYYTLR